MAMQNIQATECCEMPRMGAWRFVWAVAFLLGLLGLWQRLTYGHHFAAYGSYVTWGLWVSAYIWLTGLSAGAFLLSSLVYVFHVKPLERLGRISLLTALITLLMALLSIWFDLGHMERFFYVFIRPNFQSMMAWMVWLYTAYTILLAAELYLVLKAPARMKLLQILGAIGIPIAVAFSGGVGALFATVAARPYWHSPIVPIFFLTGALVSGGGLLLGISAFLYPMLPQERKNLVQFLAKIVAGLLLFDLLLEWAEFSVSLWYGFGEKVRTLHLILFGPFWWVFWIVHLLLGSLIPLYLIFTKKEPAPLGIAGFLIAITFMAVRLNIVIPALVTPELEGLQTAFRDQRLRFDYIPSLHEWLVVLFIVSLGIALFYLSCKWLCQREDQLIRITRLEVKQ
jgi:molybdopterin-containing oxidoreductase family membrane subunit